MRERVRTERKDNATPRPRPRVLYWKSRPLSELAYAIATSLLALVDIGAGSLAGAITQSDLERGGSGLALGLVLIGHPRRQQTWGEC